MTSASRLWVPIAVALVTLHASPVAAQQQGADAGAADPVREEARASFLRGVELIGLERWAEAITALQRARELRATPPVLYNLGLAFRAVGRNREAMSAFREFVRMGGAASNPELGARVQAYIQELSSGLGWIELSVEPATARVTVDGAPARASEPVEVDPGRHVVVVDAEGFSSETRTIDVRRGGQAQLTFRMVPSVMSSRVTVEATPGTALVRIDGENIGFGTVDEIVRPGSHTLTVSAEGFNTFRRSFEALAGQNQTLRAALTSNRTVFESPWFWLGVGVVAVGAGVASYLLLQDVAPPYQGTLGTVTDAINLGRAR